MSAHLHLPGIEITPADCTYLEPGESFTLAVEGQVIGHAGKVREKIARRFEVKQPVILAQLRLEPLKKLSRPLAAFKPLPVYPAATRDLALIVAKSVRVGDLTADIKKTAGALAESVEVFDLYTGQQIGEDAKSVAIAISFRSFERSLSSDEVDKLLEQIVGSLKQHFDAKVRDF